MVKIAKALLKSFGGATLADPEGLYDGFHEVSESPISVKILGKEFCCPHCEGTQAFEVKTGVAFCDKIYLSCVKFCALAHSKMPKSESQIARATCYDVGADFDFTDATLSDVMKEHQKAYLELSKMLHSGKGQLVLSGLPGRGKTHMACGWLNDAMKRGKSGLYISIPTLYQDWLDSFKDNSGPFLPIIKAKDRDFLIIDELGVGNPSEGFLSVLYNLISSRYSDRERKSTVYTTNLVGQEIGQSLGHAILSRLSGGIILQIDGPDKRLDKNEM